MNEIIEFITQIEVLGSVGVGVLLGGVAFVRKQFKNGLLVKSLVAYGGKKLIELFTSDNPEDREKANQVLDVVLALPKIQALFDKVASGADTNVAMLEAGLADVKVKLEVGDWSNETTQQLIKAQQSLQAKLDEITS